MRACYRGSNYTNTSHQQQQMLLDYEILSSNYWRKLTIQQEFYTQDSILESKLLKSKDKIKKFSDITKINSLLHSH